MRITAELFDSLMDLMVLKTGEPKMKIYGNTGFLMRSYRRGGKAGAWLRKRSTAWQL